MVHLPIYGIKDKATPSPLAGEGWDEGVLITNHAFFVLFDCENKH